ncbi:hypothetical protein R1sor_014880 [Riccia sorocarpa]|uniref:Protein kinase domain-containing protein n=1 Tax=Riccia sorocarpa TaxID=122646 RepID=A0ABD3HEW1_9MARC
MDQHVYGMEASALELQKRMLRAVKAVPTQLVENYDKWLKSPQFDAWSMGSEDRKWALPWQLRSPGLRQEIFRTRARVWEVGCLDPTLVKQLGAHDVVFYVAKRLVTRGTRTGFDEGVKEMSAFPISHPAICRPIGGMLDRETPTLLFPWWNGGHIAKWTAIEHELRWRLAPNGLRWRPLSFKDWHSCILRIGFIVTSIPSRNIFVHFPLWDWDDKGKVDVRVDNPSDANARRIKRKLVFVALGDLGWAQKKKDAEKGRFSLDKHERTTREWVAPELTYPKAPYDAQGNQYVTNFTESSDVFALGWVLKELCGDFFTQMSPRLLALYDESMFAKGFPTSSRTSLPHSFHAAKLKEALDIMTTRNIANRPDIRRTAHYWATFFHEQLMVDPFECQRPIEDKPRAKEHPDGPRELGRDLL